MKILRPLALWLLTSGLCLFAAGCVTHPKTPGHRTVLPPADTAVTLPAEIIGGNFLVVTQWDASGPWCFLVDTGSTATLVSPDFARRHATDEPAGEMPALRVRSADGGSILLPGVRVPLIALGAARFENVTALVYDFAELSAHLGRKVDGILGFPLFRETVLTLDYPRAQLRLAPADATATPDELSAKVSVTAEALAKGGQLAPLVGDRRRPVVVVQLGDRPLNVLLDTGAAGALHLNPGDLAPRYAVPPRPGVTVSTLTGDRLQEIGRLADDLAIGNTTFPRPVVELTDQPSSLGTEVLRQFRLTFDTPHGLVALERAGNTPLVAATLRSAGLSFRRFPAYWRIVSVVPGSPADEAGLETGDLVTRVNGERVEAWSLDRYEALVRTAPAIEFTLLTGRTETIERIRTFDLVP